MVEDPIEPVPYTDHGDALAAPPGGPGRGTGGAADKLEKQYTDHGDALMDLQEKTGKAGAKMDEVCTVADALRDASRNATDALGVWGQTTATSMTSVSAGSGAVGVASAAAAGGLTSLASSVSTLNSKIAKYDPLSAFSNAINTGKINITVNVQNGTVVSTVTTVPTTGLGGSGLTGGSGTGKNR
jgi:hypothetical protein